MKYIQIKFKTQEERIKFENVLRKLSKYIMRNFIVIGKK